MQEVNMFTRWSKGDLEVLLIPIEKQDLCSQVPQAFWDYLDVFSEKHAKQMPQRHWWDHKIDLTLDFIPKKAKEIWLFDADQKELNKFITKNLEKGYICPLDSPQTSPVFFVGKKDRSK